jgi:hypothetical protein
MKGMAFASATTAVPCTGGDALELDHLSSVDTETPSLSLGQTLLMALAVIGSQLFAPKRPKALPLRATASASSRRPTLAFSR